MSSEAITRNDLTAILNEVLPNVAIDYVVTQGQAAETTNGTGNWRWREWNSGKVEIWYRGTLTLGTTPGAASGITRKSGRFSFPNNYELYKCTCHVDGTYTGAWYMCGGILNALEGSSEPKSKFEVMGYSVSGTPNGSPNVSVYICGEKSSS